MSVASTSEESPDSAQRIDSFNGEQSVYFVPFRWWKDAQESVPCESVEKREILYTAATTGSSYGGPMKLINNIFNSDILFDLRREGDDALQSNDTGEASVSGRDFALVSSDMWLQALKWHHNDKINEKGVKSFSTGGVDRGDVYPVQLRLSVLQETNSLAVKICKKDNSVECFRRACKIFSLDSEQLRIWDISGQTTLFFQKDMNNSKACQQQTDQEILLELQIYGLSDSINLKESKKEDGSTHQTNGITNGTTFRFGRSHSLSFLGKAGEAGTLGLTGLQNLGNTCFMNSSLQCLAHTPKLVDFFLGEYIREINLENPLGMKGEIALAFGDLLRSLWAPGASTVTPRTFKAKLGRFAPQFSGFNQHDSQELLAFLLDGLHEDLNRVKNKPYVEAKDGDGRPDEEVADEYWRNHMARNDSIIVDVCQGQYKSTLVCPICKKVSVMFDPFMYLSLPLPCTSIRTMDLTVMSADGGSLPVSVTVNVPKFGKFEDLQKALVTACSLPEDETLMVTEVYNNRILRVLEDPSDSLSLIRDGDKLVVYRLKKDANDSPLIVFMHQKLEEQFICGKSSPTWKGFGIPLVSRLCDVENGFDVEKMYLKLLSSFKMPSEVFTENLENPTEEEATEKAGTDGTTSAEDKNSTDVKETTESVPDPVLRLYLTDDIGGSIESEILKEKPVNIKSKRLNVLARWPVKELDVYDTCLLSSLPEVSKFGTKRPQETVSLYKCLEAFLTEEPLGPDDMWYCPGCKEHRQAIKKLDLWRLPEILVIHLKRFSYSRFMKNKLEAFVDFPIDGFDLSSYISYKNGQTTYHYMLYAISNHYGGMGGGHYTAYVHHGGDRWYDFDDSHVNQISQEKIKTSAAYVLFYKRLVEE
ncbi:ubiquitin carboxyl-terminal hydrolase 8-like [Brassica napus]|uniref:ubiquitin carboxyl-terminal hydrolase 8-like n=1 Tax=Brassica napus TaxID=3708 RepID=UPI0020793CD6|nr:ubiquitin carboxyl-terminal hydrolase 8-like [Brassica napus]XP_048608098.1 ubiquitin carboxyl-terminal hydrolase 8-like [Brassica napus]XP_048608100.1 ubiquitin carboxyl-terminal hydrolase 8-like [Brassica napus]